MTSEPRRTRVVGLMSGTSLDGIDAALLEVREGTPSPRVELLAFHTQPYRPEARDRILEAIAGTSPERLARLHVELGEWFAGAVRALLAQAGVEAREVAAIGSHGQTLWHTPPTSELRGVSLQIGCAATLAERTGIAVVSDFRSRDTAAGGHGAPLVPWADAHLFGKAGVGRALQNLGGMGNVTFLPGNGAPARAFDTGPGVALLDGAARLASDGLHPFDAEGRRAARGAVNEPLLQEWLNDPFFRVPPPRSTGREAFGETRLSEMVARAAPDSDGDWDDLLATLTALTARSVARAYRDFLPMDEVDEVILTGGGARNPALVRALTQALAPLPVRTGAPALGMDPDAREAAAFALMAWAHLQGIPANLPQVTGAQGPRVLGSLTP